MENVIKRLEEDRDRLVELLLEYSAEKIELHDRLKKVDEKFTRVTEHQKEVQKALEILRGKN
nr:hypothetical protein [Heyndrickxia oleronia]